MKMTVDGHEFVLEYDYKTHLWYTTETPIQGAMAEAPTIPELHLKLQTIIKDLKEEEDD